MEIWQTQMNSWCQDRNNIAAKSKGRSLGHQGIGPEEVTRCGDGGKVEGDPARCVWHVKADESFSAASCR